MEGSVFYFNIYELLIPRCDPKTRFNLIRTCKRFWNMFTTIEKKYMYIGREMPINNKLPNDYLQCPLCKQIIRKTKYSTHVNKCTIVRENVKVCYECLLTYKGEHKICQRTHICWICRDQNCDKYCMLNQVDCNFCVGKKHLYGLTLKKCEVCSRFVSVCPYNRPRCFEHRFFNCFVCKEIDVDYTHKCKLIEHQLSCKYHKKFIKTEENVYQDIESKINFICVKDEHSIPSLLKYADCYVFIEVGTYIMRYDTIFGIFTKLNHCWNCGTTIGIKKCSGCKSVHYCSLICQSANWKIHKNKCLAKGVS